MVLIIIYGKPIILNDKPELVGKTNRRADCKDLNVASVFEEFRKDEKGRFIALKAIERLIKECRSPYILLPTATVGEPQKRTSVK